MDKKILIEFESVIFLSVIFLSPLQAKQGILTDELVQDAGRRGRFGLQELAAAIEFSYVFGPRYSDRWFENGCKIRIGK